MREEYCQFALIHEGSSDQGLTVALETLLAEAGFDIVRGEAHLKRGTVAESLATLATNREFFNVVFVHRDSDRAGREARVAEVTSAASSVTWAVGDEPRVVPVIPITMTEAWLLLDEAAIRDVCGNSRGTAALGLPKPHEVEGVSDPKKLLFEAMRKAGPQGGRRRGNERDLNRWRARLLERLDVHGPVRNLSGWKALEEDIAKVWEAHRAGRQGG